MPKDGEDERLQARMMQLLKPETLSALPRNTFRASAVKARPAGIPSFSQSTSQSVARPISTPEGSSRTAREPLSGRHIVRGTPDGVPTTPELQELWRSSEGSDSVYRLLKKAVRDGDRLFPKDLEIKVSINECKLSPEGHLLFRDRRWVPDSEELRTKLI
jgi:hypothetical protein